MKRIAFLVNNVYVEGVSILRVNKGESEKDWYYKTLLVYAQNRLILLRLEKYYFEDTGWAYNTLQISILENYCVMEDCENYLSSHPDVEEDYVDNW